MYTNSAYLNNSLIDFKDKSRPLIVGSCGTYHLYTTAKLPTYRPKGRIDYQLLYIASGQAHFFFDGEEKIIPAGHMIIYRPKEIQKYIYYGEDQTEVYWVHFTGNNVKNILRKNGITDDTHIIYSGTSLEYARIFKQMINELQQCQVDYEEILSMLLQQIFISLRITNAQILLETTNYSVKEIGYIVGYDNPLYFSRIFSKQKGVSPSDYRKKLLLK